MRILSGFFRRTLPTAILMAVGLVVLADLFFAAPLLDAAGAFLLNVALVVASFALVLGMLNVAQVSIRKVWKRRPGWPYAYVLLLSMIAVLVLGLADPQGRGPVQPAVVWFFENVQMPMQATLGALLIFLLATAAYRALRLRNLESAVLVLVVLVILLGQVAWGLDLLDVLPALKERLVEVVSVAGVRGILLGVALGSVLAGMRLLLGIDRPYGS
jgi:hypothetical protein